MWSRWIVVAAMLMGVGLPALGLSQGSVSMSSVEVDLWPEYDRPEMLVIYKITLAPEVRLPAALNLRIPTVAGRPNAVAEKQLDGRLTSIPYDLREQDEWTALIFTASRPELQVEYYDSRLDKDDARRTFTYTWPADYPVGALTVQAQQPRDAVDLRMDPPAEHTSPPGEGFAYHILHLGARGAGEPTEVTLEYMKETDVLSVASMPQQMPAQAQPPPVTSLPSEGNDEVPLWVFVVVAGMAIAAGGGLWWWLGHREKPAPGSAAPLGATPGSSPRRSRRTDSRAKVTDGARGSEERRPGPSAADGEAAYCTQCGTPAAVGDRFCHSCGSQLPTA